MSATVDTREAIAAISRLDRLAKPPHSTNALMQGGLVLERGVKLHITKQHLIDTGKMRASVAALPDTVKSIIIAVRTYYAIYHEWGTRKMKARPFMRPALDEYWGDIIKAVVNYFARAVKGL